VKRVCHDVEASILISLAGKAAERRSLQGSDPGWRRLRSAEELIAFHEAGHAVVARAVGWHTYEINMRPDNGQRVETGAVVLAYCSSGFTADPPPSNLQSGSPAAAKGSRNLWSDRHKAAYFALLEKGDWRRAYRYLSELRLIADALVDANWLQVRCLAQELERCPLMGRVRIYQILAAAGAE
jgi:hypothetical protein